MNRQKHSLPRRVLAILLMAAMLITMLPSAMLATETTTDETQTWQISKSKTATNLDENYQSEVTLSLPAAQEQLESDVVFVLDKSTSANIQEDALSMLANLKEQVEEANAKVNVGIVVFNREAHSFGMFDLQSQYDKIEEAIMYDISSGTNSHAGLLAAQDMLEKSDTPDNRKYVVFVCDGITYMFDNNVNAINSQQSTTGEYAIMAGNDCWGIRHYDEGGDQYIPEDWSAYLQDVQKHMSDVEEYIQLYDNCATNTELCIPRGDTELPTTVDVALYKTYTVFQELAKNYNCYAMTANTGSAQQYPWGPAFMQYLQEISGNGDVDFDDIQNDIYYLVDEGSTVEDYMGYDEGENGYDFDLVINDKDLSNLYMTIDTLGADGESAEPKVLKATKFSENTYGFGDERDGRYDYELVYTPADNGEEHFTWKTNVPLTNFERVQLHYTVKLTNPQTTPGTYGEYDADGSLEKSGLFTNNEAKLTAVDSNNNRIVEYFAKPTVSYKVDAVLDGDTYLNITKKFMGSSWPSNEKFQFEIKAADNSAANTPLPENTRITIAAPSNGSENSGAFGNITYTEPGTYIYTITEVEGNHDNIIYDDHVLTITVTVDKDMNIAVDTDGSRTFTNIRWNDETTPGTTDEETPDLNTQDHYSYIVGYPEDYRTGEATDNEDLWPVKPQGNITRAEVATIFYRLLTDEARAENWTQSNDFTDVSSDDWFNTPVSTLSAMGILTGYEDGSFQPNAPITRAEFAAIAVRFYENDSVDYTDGTFSDITGSEWFADAVQAAKEQGIIGGYPDGSFQPNKAITRAEACSIVNRTLDRVPHEDYLLPDTIMRTWPDNQKGAWYYADIQEATNGHEYEWVTSDGTNHENWTGDRDEIDWDEVERELEALHGVN